ncbi:MAG: EAL and HDOD domain-containing protein [Rhodanobacteraceae bacterium]
MSALVNEITETEDRLGFLLSYRPVYARSKSVAAYDILLGGHGGDSLAIAQLASRVVLGAYADIYQNGRMETVPNFLRVTPATFRATQAASLPKDQYILEIDAAGDAPPGLLERTRALSQSGYRLALAGYRPGEDGLIPLLDLVQVVRLDLRRLGMAAVADAARRLRFQPVKLLVDGVDDVDQFYGCADLEVAYFQGDFLNQPAPSKGKKISNNKQVLLALLSELRKPDTSPAALEQIAIKDPGLAFRILKIINSAALGLSRRIDSLSEAINLLGTDELGRWANLLLVHGEPGKPDELVRNMLVRGRMCEIIAALSGFGEPTSYFIVGLLSRLDVMMDIPMNHLLQQVPLGADVKQALLHRGGKMGQVLAEVENYERGRFDRLTWMVDASLYEVAYRHSVNWARQSQQALGAT